MPGVLARLGEPHAQAGHLAGVGHDGVLPAALRRLGAARMAVHLDLPVHLVHVDRLAIDHLEVQGVDVDGMGVLGGVVELPHLGGAQVRRLRHGLHPFPVRVVALGVDRAELARDRRIVEPTGHLLDDGESPHGAPGQGGDRRELQVPRRCAGVR